MPLLVAIGVATGYCYIWQERSVGAVQKHSCFEFVNQFPLFEKGKLSKRVLVANGVAMLVDEYLPEDKL